MSNTKTVRTQPVAKLDFNFGAKIETAFASEAPVLMIDRAGGLLHGMRLSPTLQPQK